MNLQPELYEGSALTVELHRQLYIIIHKNSKKSKKKRQLFAVLFIVDIAKQFDPDDPQVLVVHLVERTRLCRTKSTNVFLTYYVFFYHFGTHHENHPYIQNFPHFKEASFRHNGKYYRLNFMIFFFDKVPSFVGAKSQAIFKNFPGIHISPLNSKNWPNSIIKN